jgi:hypothetical protein
MPVRVFFLFMLVVLVWYNQIYIRQIIFFRICILFEPKFILANYFTECQIINKDFQ